MYRMSLFRSLFLVIPVIPTCACNTSDYWFRLCPERSKESREEEKKTQVHTNQSGPLNILLVPKTASGNV